MPSFIPQLISLLETATKHEATLFAVEHATYNYLYVARNPNELALEILWDKTIAAALPWQPLRLRGVAAYQFWQVLDLAAHVRLDYGAALMPTHDLPLVRLMAAIHFRRQHGLGERGRWATLTGTDLEEVQDLIAAYPPDAQIFSSLLTEISLPELGKLTRQLAQWQNDDLEAEVATAAQWVQQEQTTFLPSPAALAALGRFTWHDGVTVERLSNFHVRPRQWRAILAWLPVNPTGPIPLQLDFYDARRPESPLAAGRDLKAATEDFCQAYGYAVLTCRAELREWFTSNGRPQTDEAGATTWIVDAWHLAAFSQVGT